MTTLVLTILLACGIQSAEVTKSTVSTKPASGIDPAKVAAGLEAADLADGTADKTVHRCAGCALGMDGSAEHAIEKDGYTLHMCSAMCKAHYEKDLEQNLAKLAE